jgi:O-antigen ligase
MRASFAYVSWQMFLDRPLLGCGFGQFPRAKLPYLSDRSTELHLESIRGYVHHNTFLSVLVEMGLVGLGLFVLIIYRWWRHAWRLASGVAGGSSDEAASREGLALRNGSAGSAWLEAYGVFVVGLLAAWLPQLVFHEMSYTAQDNALVFFAAGLACGLRGRQPVAGGGRTPADRTDEADPAAQQQEPAAVTSR